MNSPMADDPWLYRFATHLRHEYMNPVAASTFRSLGRQLGLRPGTRVLDVACGKGTLLLRWTRDHGIAGVGIDASPHHVAEAEAASDALAVSAGTRFLVARGETWPRSDPPVDVASCMGAEWIWNGPLATLRALRDHARSGGFVVMGCPWLRRELPEEYMREEGLGPGDVLTLETIHDGALDAGLLPVFMRGSSERDWDRYEFLQLASLDDFSRDNPSQPELAAFRQRALAERRRYLRWGRDALGFATWAFRVE
jgi:SAM-dependent methyltransferase